MPFKSMFRMITSFVQERMRIGGFEMDAGEYCFLVCKWISVSKKKWWCQESLLTVYQGDV